MTFNSLDFFAFFGVVLVLYYRFGVRGQNRLIFVAGSVFYAAFDWRFLGLLWFSTLVDWAVGRGLGSTDDKKRRRLLVLTSVVCQLGVLGFFKYYDFFAESAHDFLDNLGLSLSPPVLDVLLPVGISFYTFQTLAYVFAVNRRQLEPERDLVTFAAFVAWFPQLVAGPIERATSLLPQIQKRRTPPDGARIESALGLILQGLVKKVVIADSVAHFVNLIYASPGVYTWLPLIFATVAFAMQVYCDFSGYSDIARGLSRLLGVELRRNFEQPFLSRNMQEFWQRWHTSLGWWFLEFVSRPLNKWRKGPLWSGFVVLLIFTLIGLWHGPKWTFVVWGAINGVYVLIWRRRKVPKNQDPDRLRMREVPRILFTFALFSLGGVFFRANDFSDVGTVFEGIFKVQGGPIVSPEMVWIPFYALLLLAIDLAERHRRVQALETMSLRTGLGNPARPEEAVREGITTGLRPAAAGLVAGAMLVALAIYSGGTPTPFFYFQF